MKPRNARKGIILLIFLFLLILMKAIVFDIYQVQGHSMEPTLYPGQIVLLNRISFGLVLPFTDRYMIYWNKPVKGDILVINNPRENKLFIKRCVATGGDQICIKDEYIFINGTRHPNPVGSALYLSEYNRVPENHILILGDNPGDSIDSRFFGFINERDVIGKIIEF